MNRALAILSNLGTGGAVWAALARAGRPWAGAAFAAWFAASAAMSGRVAEFVRKRPRWSRALDVAGLAAAAGLVEAVGAGFGDHPPLELFLPVLLASLLAVRAPLQAGPRELEFGLFGGLILAVWAGTRMDWHAGVPFVALYLLLWLSAMVIVEFMREKERLGGGGTADVAARRPWRAFLAGVRVSVLVTTAGGGAFLCLHGRFAEWLYARGAGNVARTPAAEDGPRWEGAPRVDLLAWDDPRGSETVLYRIRVAAADRLARFRIQAFDRYEVGGWSASPAPSASFAAAPFLRLRAAWPEPAILDGLPFEMDVRIVQSGARYLPTAGVPREVEGTVGPVSWDADGTLLADAPLSGGKGYVLRGTTPDWRQLSLPAAAAAVPADPRHLDTSRVSLNLAARARATAGSDPSPWVRATQLAAWLRASHDYQPTLAVPRDPALDPVDEFVFNAKSGNCLNFSSALTLMARCAGVPARLAVGYLGHRADPATGEWLITAADAHAWTEIPLEGCGWTPLDATPPDAAAGRGGPVGPEPWAPPREAPPAEAGTKDEKGGMVSGVAVFGLDAAQMVDQAAAVAGMTAPWAAVLMLAGWGVRLLARRRRRRPPDPSRHLPREVRRFARPLLDVRAAAERRGIAWRASQTPVEYARRLSASFPAVRAELAELAAAYTRAIYGDLDDTADPSPAARRVLAEMKRHPA